MLWYNASFGGFMNCFMAGSKICPKTYPFYNTSSKLCYDSCPGQSKKNYICCPLNCDKCSSSTACVTCSSGYFLRSDNICYEFCLDGTFPNSKTLTCDRCPTGCATCTSLTACKTCLTPYYLRNDSLCSKDCPPGYYP